ncbi:hypothetical protein FJU31_08675 [Stenotrophomonas cyclobalanopsidis]|uniref:Capsule biosynthesis GfcC-like C-terminal domain-containing protein n=2 Tax=Stenotrophomonas cyclobalanopsidis TaxID=2771362 RepID=A0ABQ6T1L3_9GAMM|nr:hypothetical protein FJU31_08675 [Stenotrophomonas cyclobalanopsidis]
MRRSLLMIAALLLGTALLPANCLAADLVRISGPVQNPGLHGDENDDRLAIALLEAKPTSSAFLPATFFTRRKAELEQIRLKAGVVHDLQALNSLDNDLLRELSGRLRLWVDSMPVTGRVRILPYPRLMQLQPKLDPRIQAGDAVRFLERPTTIQVVGAVAENCTLPHHPLRSALDYTKDCAATKFADPDSIIVIQVDSTVQTLGAGAWNRADPQPVSPGGVILVPLAKKYLQTVDADFNADLAALIATQAANP